MKLPSTGIHEETLQHIAKVFSSEPGGDMTMHSGELGGIWTKDPAIMKLGGLKTWISDSQCAEIVYEIS